MEDISWDGAAYVRRLQEKHSFFVTFDELGGEDNIKPFRSTLRRAAKAAGMRVHTFRGAHEPILWIVDPDYTPTPESMRRAVEAAATFELDEEPASPRSHLPVVE